MPTQSEQSQMLEALIKRGEIGMDPSVGKLHFTLGAAPTGNTSLENDLQMVKVALLYADAAKLCSLTTSMLLQIAAVGELTQAQRLEFLEELLPAIAGSMQTQPAQQVVQIYKQISSKKYRTTKEIIYQRRLEQMIDQMWAGPGGMREVVYNMTNTAGAEGIAQAYELGLLEIHIFDSTGKDKEIVKDYFDVVSAAVTEGTTYPLFDDSTGNLVRAWAKEGKLDISPGDVSRGKHSGLVGNLLSRLPLFERASVEEILDIRKELEKPLVRFRSAVIRFSDEIRSAQWDKDFSTEADSVFYREIEPAVLEIQEAVRENKFLSQLTGKVFDAALQNVTPAGIGVIISQLDSLPDIVKIALSLGLPAATISNTVLQDWKKSRQSITQNQLYFYYRAGEELKRR